MKQPGKISLREIIEEFKDSLSDDDKIRIKKLIRERNRKAKILIKKPLSNDDN